MDNRNGFYEKMKTASQSDICGFLQFITSLNKEELSAFIRFEADLLLNRLKQLGKTATFAESCTGGLLAANFTALPGASECFEGSFVTYSNRLKHKLVGVCEKTLEEHGAVSDEVVREMCIGAQNSTDAFVSVATSGYAGPGGGTYDCPVGTVYIGVRCRDDIRTFRLEVQKYIPNPDRATVQSVATAFAFWYAAKATA